jgi:hypothetical protein
MFFTNKHTLYGFKHTGVVQLLRAGVPAQDIMEYTGHKDFKSFMCYANRIFKDPPKDLSDKYSVHL